MNFIFLSVIIAFFATVNGDAHEPLVKLTSGGYPYYSIKTSGDAYQSENYEDVVPIVFEFATPNWTAINLIGYTCTGDNYDVDGYSCPVLWYWLTQIRDVLQPEILISSQKIEDDSGYRTNAPCSLLHNYFSGTYLSQSSRAAFLQFIQTNCDFTGILPRDERYTAATINEPYRRMREKYFEEYYELQTPVNRSNDFQYTNARYNLYSSGLFHYYIEAQRWVQAVSECKSGRLPQSLIKTPELSNVLTSVEQYTGANGMELVYGRNLSRYYKQNDLVDCAWTPESLIVVLQVPTRTAIPPEDNMENVEIIPVPWRARSRKDDICYLKLEDNQNPREKRQCNLQGTLCKRGNSTVRENWLRRKSCEEVLSQENGQTNDAQLCKIQCEPKSLFELPMIHRISEDRVVIFGDSNSDVRISCFNKEQKLDLSENAVEVTVPCGCAVKSGEGQLFKSDGSCGDEVHVVSIASGAGKTAGDKSS